jgi:tetratricopeptide (TPR) repeat protein
VVQAILELPEQAVRQALGSLVNLSVLRRPEQNYVVSHPLVHTFAIECLPSPLSVASSPSAEVIMLWRERLLSTLMTQFEQGDRYDVSVLARWLPHVLPWLIADDLRADLQLRAARLFNTAALATFTLGKYAQAEPLLQRALLIREQHLGAEHPDTATSLNNLAGLYWSQGNYAQAEPLLVRALSIVEQKFGAEHPNTATCLNNLAELYRDQSKYSEAEPLYQRALSIVEQKLGAMHPKTATCLNNLAELYRGQSKYSEAEPLLVRALSIVGQQLGAEHPTTAICLNNLAELYQSQGKYSEAESLLVRAVSIYKQQLGMEHLRTQQMVSNYLRLLAEIHTGGDLEALPQWLAQARSPYNEKDEG